MSLNNARHVVLGSLSNTPPTPPTPVLPEKTIRCKFTAGYTPAMGDNQTLVDAGENIWDIYKSSDDWTGLFTNCTALLEVLGANTTGVTNMGYMFSDCTNLAAVPLFDTSSVTRTNSMFYSCTNLTAVPLFNTSSVTLMQNMFRECTSLTIVPLFDTSNVTNMDDMFRNCFNVESGALALYQQANGQAVPPSSHRSCFAYCGSHTTTGRAELAQIPSDWK